MKRAIKFYNKYESDDIKFSYCSTHYEVLPFLVSDEASSKELRSIANKMGYVCVGNVKTNKPDKYGRNDRITHAIKLNEKTEKDYQGTHRDYYIGFITINTYHNILKPIEKADGIITACQSDDILNNQIYGVEDIGVLQGNEETIVVMSGWEYFHEMRLLGYDHNQFQEVVGAPKGSEGRDFYDSVFKCAECGLYDYESDGYHYNYRMTDDGPMGLNCGCYHEHMKDNYLENVNDSNKCIELDVMKELKKEGKVEFIERFIGGMTYGRGGYYAGKSCREGSPEGILEELLKKSPKSKFLFSHDESGQFQTYFSVWKVTKKGLNKNKKTA